jgi:exonuclease SbcD
MSSTLKIFHCADLHLGLKFARYPADVADKLREARFTSLERMVARANAEGCELFVVAGDLFDTLKVAARDVARAAKILAGFDRVVALLPGNHDFHAGTADEFWRDFPLPEHGRLLLLGAHRAVSLADFGIDAVLYPSSCNRKKSERDNALGWLRDLPRLPGKFQIGLAHGSFEGLTPDMEGTYFPMTERELTSFGLDLWMLGHIHVQFPVSPSASHRIFYSGTHEPDGMNFAHEGRAWRIDLHADKKVEATSVVTGAYRFEIASHEVRASADLDAVLARYSAAGSREKLLRLKLSGSLPKADFDKLTAFGEALKARVLYFEPDYSALRLALTPADIDREYPRDSFAHRLLTSLASSESDRDALQAAFELLGDTRA